jgi:hypothetical protein
MRFIPPSGARVRPAIAVAAAVALGLAVAAGPARSTLGQSTASATVVVTATSNGPTAAPALDSETAVRMLLPPSIQNSERLPVYKWGRADMPNAPGGYAVFIATVYPLRDDAGNSSDWLLANYLQWDGYQWVPGIPNYQGRKLLGDDRWLAQNLTDITAVPSPPDQTWRVFTVGYTADGPVSAGLSRTETLVEIYDLSLTTVWSRVDTLDEIDSSNAGYTKEHTENVDWTFQDLDGDGISELVATVTDADTITRSDGTAGPPPDGTTRSTSTEVYKWVDGVYVLQRQPPAPTPSPTPVAAGAPTRTPTPTPQSTP